jgi:starch synthase
VTGRLWRSSLPDSDVAAVLIEQADYFERDDPTQGRGLYQFNLPGGQKRDYPDNCERFVFFARAVLEALRLLDLWPDVLHCHDWQAGLIPVYLREVYSRHTSPEYQERYERIRSVFTIHNIAYQGLFRQADLPLTGLDWRLFNYRQLEFYGQINFMKAGIVFSDRLTTVSPRYAEEIQTPYYGCGLQGVISERRDRLTGIVNGVDYRVWAPDCDPHLAVQYNEETVAQGKPLCKAALQRRYRLREDPQIPLLGMIARLVEQKGVDLLVNTAEALLVGIPAPGPDGKGFGPGRGAQLVVLGEGDPAYHRMLLDLQSRHPDRVGVTLAFDDRLAHQIEGGADIYLMPSHFEPSGLNQLYSLKYGTVPVVRACGGLADTIVDATPTARANGTATGFQFLAYTPAAFLQAIKRALEIYHGPEEDWLRLVRTCMKQDWSWDRSAAEYEKVYGASA